MPQEFSKCEILLVLCKCEILLVLELNCNNNRKPKVLLQIYVFLLVFVSATKDAIVNTFLAINRQKKLSVSA